MRLTPFIVGTLLVIGLGSVLVRITPQASRTRLAPIVSLAPSLHPPQHTTPCDFANYVPPRIPDWSERSITGRARSSYPTGSQQRGMEGTVTVYLLINREGVVERACSTGPGELR